MRALVLFAILLGLLIVIYAAASSRTGNVGPSIAPAPAPATRSAVDLLTIIAVHEDGADEETARGTLAHCLEILHSRYKDSDDRLGDMIYNTKTSLKEGGIPQRLVDCATDLAEITPILTDGQGTLRDTAAAYVTLRKAGHDRTNAVELTAGAFRGLARLSDAVSAGQHHDPPRAPPAAAAPAAEPAPTAVEPPPPAAPAERPKIAMYLDLKDKWQHAILVTAVLGKTERETDELKVRQVISSFVFDATYGREGQVSRLLDAIIAAVGEEVRDSLVVNVDWKL